MKETREFPPLVFSKPSRAREFNLYNDKQRAAVLYNYLVNGISYRPLDSEILKVPFDSHGYQSMGICHYLGITDPHKGFFKGWLRSDILNKLSKLAVNPDYCIIYYYIADYFNDHKSLTDVDRNQLLLSEKTNPKEEVQEKNWIYNTLLVNTQKDKTIDTKLLSLPSHVESNNSEFYIKKDFICYIRHATITESVKSLYNYRCQICGDVILRTGWEHNLERKEEWKYLSADVHHIHPLSEGGEDDRRNMLCLCPSCHRKFHSGEFRLKPKANNYILNDELLGKTQPITLKHQIIVD